MAIFIGKIHILTEGLPLKTLVVTGLNEHGKPVVSLSSGIKTECVSGLGQSENSKRLKLAKNKIKNKINKRYG